MMTTYLFNHNQKNMKKLTLFRQGDVLIERVASVPTEAQKLKSSKRITLALGEATGHHHTLECDDPADWWKRGDEQFVSLSSTSILTHQEHAPIDLSPGIYRVTRQREYSPEAIRNVQD